MNDADLSPKLTPDSDPELHAAEPLDAVLPESSSAAGYLWRPMEPPVSSVEPAPPPPPRIIPNLGHSAVFFLLLIPSFIGGWLITFAVLRLVLHSLPTQDVILRVGHQVSYAISAQAAAYGIQWGLAALVFSLWWRTSFARGVQWNSAAAGRSLLRLALLGIATGLVITLAGNFLPMPKAPPILKDLTNSRAGAWMLMAFGITLAPLTEELAFRGFLLPSLVNTFRWFQRRGVMSETSVRVVGIPIAIVLTSVPFAMIHAEQVSGSWGPLLLIAMVSVVLCIIRLSTQSVATSVVVHMFYNLTLFTGLLVQTDFFRHLDKLKG